MALDWDTKAAFDATYARKLRPGLWINYHWWSVVRPQVSIAAWLHALLGLQTGETVILVGCGWNGTGAGLEALGVNVVGTETSGYILGAAGGTEETEIRAACVAAGVDPDADLILDPKGEALVDPLDFLLEGGRASPAVRGKGEILDQDLRTNGSRNAVKNRYEQLGYPAPRFVISEEVLNSVDDPVAELVADYMDAAVASWGSTAVHMLSPLHPSSTNQHPDLNWKTYAGWRAFLDGLGYQSHLIVPTVTAEGQGMHLPDHATVLARETARLLAEGMSSEEAAAEALVFADAHVAAERVETYSGTF